MQAKTIVLGLLLLVCVMGATGLTLLPALAQAAPETTLSGATLGAVAGLPPRPTPPPPAAAPIGGLIILEIPFGEGWPARAMAWQDLWTAVEWQDAAGDWHTVEGWQGGIDSVTYGEGSKQWWLSADLLGRGPFRWKVYDARGGAVLAVSDAFNLPGYNGGIVTVTLPLE